MNDSSKQSVNDMNEAWAQVGDAVHSASELYQDELAAYMSWSRDFQREVWEQGFITGQRVTRLWEEQWAFLVRLRDSIPSIGTVPKGTETVVGMVDAVVHEADTAE